MKYYTGLDNFEINAPKKYYKYRETENFRVFADRENPDAYDANFAILKTLKDVEESIKQVEIFHEAAGAIPLFVSAPDSVILDEASFALENHGYAFCEEELSILTTVPKVSYKDIPASVCDIRAHKVLRGAERELCLTDSEGQDYGMLMIDKKLAAGARYFAAYNRDQEPVSHCVCEGYGEVMYICNVFTLPEYRRKGYAKALLCTALSYAHEKSYAVVYLEAQKDEAIALYSKLGFESVGIKKCWKAYKGGIPDWMKRHLQELN